MNPKRRSDCQFSALALTGEAVLTPVDGLDSWTLNPIATVVWSLCDGAHSVEEIAGLIASNDDAMVAARLHRDVLAVLEALATRGLFEEAES